MTPAAVPGSLALVRHGESTWIAEGRFQGRGDPPLSDVGRQQAAAVARRLADPDRTPALPLPPGAPLAVWHSPLARAAQTAHAIHVARGQDAPLRPLDDLAELGQGDWEGLTHDEVRARYPGELAAWRRDPRTSHAPGGESLGEALERARAAARVILGSPTGSPAHLHDASTVAPSAGPSQPAEPVLGYERRFGPGEDAAATRWSIVVAHDGILRLMLFDLLGLDASSYWSFPFGLAAVTVLDRHSGVVRLRVHNQPADVHGG